MPPPADHPCLRLTLLPNRYFVIKLEAEDSLPEFALSMIGKPVGGKFISVTRTNEEISIAGEEFEGMPADVEKLATWRCIKIKGPMDFGLVGVVASFTAPLKDNKVPVFVVSTWNTDYILISSERAVTAVEALKADGWAFEE